MCPAEETLELSTEIYVDTGSIESMRGARWKCDVAPRGSLFTSSERAGGSVAGGRGRARTSGG
jgi:hypothetical protein